MGTRRGRGCRPVPQAAARPKRRERTRPAKSQAPHTVATPHDPRGSTHEREFPTYGAARSCCAATTYGCGSAPESGPTAGHYTGLPPALDRRTGQRRGETSAVGGAGATFVARPVSGIAYFQLLPLSFSARLCWRCALRPQGSLEDARVPGRRQGAKKPTNPKQPPSTTARNTQKAIPDTRATRGATCAAKALASARNC